MKTERSYVFEGKDDLPFLCFSSILNVIFQRRHLPRLDPIDVSKELGLVVPRRYSSCFPDVRYSDDELVWGVHPNGKETSLSSVLQRRSLPLHSTFFPINEICLSELSAFIQANLEANNDIIVGYEFGSIFDSHEKFGHSSLLIGVDDVFDLYVLADTHLKRKVTRTQLINGVKKINSGFWVFSEDAEKVLDSSLFSFV